jgi:hypothetical protein
MLRLTLETGMMKLGRVALDGSKVKDNASKHNAMRYGRIKKRIADTAEIGGATNYPKSYSGGKHASHGYGKPRARDKDPKQGSHKEVAIQLY